MNNYFLCFLFSVILIPFSQAQFGISGQILSYPIVEWEEQIGDNFHDISYGGAIDYWMRLKNYRWEMVPTISFNTSSKVSSESVAGGSDINMSAYKFHFKNNVYPLDFKNDCDCPTFSKQSGWFQKSLFIQLAPGYALHRVNVSPTEIIEGIIPLDQNIHSFEVVLGVGFDIGISDFLTISPYFNYVYNTNKSIQLSILNPIIEANMNHYLFGVRLGFRPDYARPSYRSKRARRMFK